jgi:hypothetical protein
MKFLVTRTSLFLDDTKPCDDAQRCNYISVDERTVNHPDKLYPKNKFTSDWYNDPRFFNHRVEHGHIKRDQNREGWCICLNTLDELKLFADKHGRCVVSNEDGNPDMMSIEIYDTYRE